MAIFGMRQVHSVVDGGEFYCPTCGQSRPYEVTETRRWWFVGVKLIPFDRLGRWVRCQICDGTFDSDVLDLPPRDTRAFRRAVLHAMIAMMRSDGFIDDTELEALRGIYLLVAREELTDEDIRQVMAETETHGRPIEEVLADLKTSLNAAEAELVIQGAFRVAMADGHLASEEKRMLRRLALALGRSEAWLRNFLQATAPGMPSRRE